MGLLQAGEVGQLRHPLTLLDVVRDQHRDRPAVEGEVEHRLRASRAQARRELRGGKVDRFEVLQRRGAAQAQPKRSAHARVRTIAREQVVGLDDHLVGGDRLAAAAAAAAAARVGGIDDAA